MRISPGAPSLLGIRINNGMEGWSWYTCVFSSKRKFHGIGNSNREGEGWPAARVRIRIAAWVPVGGIRVASSSRAHVHVARSVRARSSMARRGKEGQDGMGWGARGYRWSAGLALLGL